MTEEAIAMKPGPGPEAEQTPAPTQTQPTPSSSSSEETKKNSSPNNEKNGNDHNGVNDNKEITTKTETNKATPNKQQTRHEDENPLKLKSQYILETYHPAMTPIVDTRNSNHDNNDSNNNNNNNKQKENRHKKNKRELKKRSRENDSTIKQICKAFMMGKECPYGDACKYSHDFKEILATREDDIKEIGTCPHYELKGECPYGIACRIGAEHLNLATGQNICKSVEEIEALRKKHNTKVMNILSRETVTLLRKKKYKFECKRFGDKGGKKKNKNDRKGKVENDDDAKFAKKIDVKVGEGGVEKSDKEPTENGSNEDEVKKEEDVKMDEPPKNDDLAKSTDVTANSENTKKVEDVKMEETNNGTTKPTETSSSSSSTPKPKPPIDMSPLPKTRKIIDFANKVYIAPLTTVGNLPFRRVMKKFGADITCGEMAVANNLLQGKNSEWALLKRHPDEDVFGVQIAAAHADVYTRLCEVIENEQLDVDFLDMNLGCPIDVMCNQGCGAKLMLRDNKLRDSLKGMLSVLNIPVTVKIRTGWDEKKPFAHKLVPKIQEWTNGGVGLAAVMLHGRSRLQRYSRLANWDYIQEVQSAQKDDIPKVPIIGNGDIFSYNDYEEKVLKHEGLSPTAMLGRGALIKPWLPTEIKERRHWDISASERFDFLKDFVRFGLEHWGSDQQGVNTTRRFLLEWLSFLYRYVPVGLLEVLPQSMNQRPPEFMCGRNDLETLMMSKNSKDWVKISEMLLGPVPEGFEFEPKHKAKSYK